MFPDALDVRVLKAANYLHQHGLARPILVASPFALRQFALSHRVAMDGIQVIDPQSNVQMREEFACAGGQRRVKNAAGCAGEAQRSADVCRRDGQCR